MGNNNKIEEELKVMESVSAMDNKLGRTTRVKKGSKLLFFTLLSYFFFSFALGILQYLLGSRLPFLHNTICSVLVSQTGLILPTVFFLWKNRCNPLKFLNIRFLHPITVVLLVIFSYACYPIISLFNYLSLQFSKNVVGNSISSLYTEYPLWISIIVIAGLPCIIEEIIFRGMLYQSYRSAGLVKAGIVTAILFGFFHMNINQMSYAVILGIFFIILNELTGSIFSSMIVHFVINGTSVWLSCKTYSITENIPADATNVMISPEFMIIILGFMSLVSLAVLGTLLYAMVYIEKRQETVLEIWETRKKQKEQILTPALIITILICIGMMVWNQINFI